MLFAWWWYGELYLMHTPLSLHLLLKVSLVYCVPKSASMVDGRPYSINTVVKWLLTVSAVMFFSGLTMINRE